MERPVEANKYISGLQDQEKRPDLLLVNSPINDYTNVVRPDTEQLPAFGLAHIATECERAGFNVGVVDAEAHALSPEIAAQVINKANPRFVGINMLTPTFPLARRILANLNRDIPIAAGGAHAKAMPERILRDVEIGGRIITLALEDGEYIMRGILDGVPPESMGGVAYLDKHGEFVEVRHDIENKWIPKDLDEMHFADRKFLPLDPFPSQDRLETNMVGSRGCPFNCRFCAGASEQLLFGVRNRTPDSLVAELGELQDEGINAVRFIDDLFLANKKRMTGFFTQMIETGLSKHFVWDATGRVNTLSKLDDEMLALIAKSGAREISIGAESANPRVLDIHDKSITPEMVVTTVAKLASVGVRTKAYFILGSPTETAEEMQQTVNFMHKLRRVARQAAAEHPVTPNGTKNTAQCRGSMFEFRPYPGTTLYNYITGREPWPQDDCFKGREKYMYSEEEILDGFQPVIMEGLEERQKHNYTTSLPFSEVAPSEIQAMIADAMRTQRDEMKREGEYLPGIKTSSAGQIIFSREVESQ
jgi:radical SAM superfamily enzyme YgiQ (UPF0313 family)